MDYTCLIESPVGLLTVASDGDSLTGLWLAGQKYFAQTLADNRADNNSLPVFAKVRTWLMQYFNGAQPAMNFALAPPGTTFQQAVWQILLNIPFGQVTTYGAIAQQMAAQNGRKPMSAQAVGGAVGHNPISIIIPCHRVVGANGSLTGYAGGINKKITLLELEKVPLDKLFVPRKGTAL